MKKVFLVLSIVLATTALKAQDGATGHELSIGLDGGLPIGSMQDYRGFGIGGTLKYAYNFDENVAATFQSGFISFSGKTVQGIKFPAFKTIPFKAGVRYTFPGGFYGEPQLGLTSGSVSGGGGSSTSFTYAFNVGYRTSPGIDISTRYEAWTKGGSSSFIGLRIAYAFPLGSN